jgi:hypothetical protein
MGRFVVRKAAAPRTAAPVRAPSPPSIRIKAFSLPILPDLVQDTIAIRHFLLVVLTFFGAAALVLSAFSIGLLSFITSSRIREVGIRMALRATS